MVDETRLPYAKCQRATIIDVTSRATLHNLLDDVPDNFLPFIEANITRLYAFKDDPFWRALADAETVDEHITPKERASIDAAWASKRAGLSISDEKAQKLLA